MAIAKHQHPQYLHPVNTPVHYTVTSNNSDEMYFKFLYNVKGLTGTIYKGNSSPVGSGSLGIINPNEPVRDGLFNTFEPSIKTYTNVAGWLSPYCLYIKDDFKQPVPPPKTAKSTSAEINFHKNVGYIAWDTKFNIDDYLLHAHSYGDFLTKLGNTHYVRSSDEFTLRYPNGYVDPTDNTRVSSVQRYRIEAFFNGKLYLLKSQETNPEYKKVQLPEPTRLEDLSPFIQDLPAGVPNVDMNMFDILGYWEHVPGSGGGGDAPALNGDSTDWVWHDQPNPNFAFPASVWWDNGILEWYNIYTYDDALGRTSKAHKFRKLVECRFDPIQVAWLNSLGGYDYYNFTKKNEEGKKFKNSTYDRYPFEIDGTSMVELDRGDTVYFSKYDNFITLLTDFLDQTDIDGLYDLFSSPDIHINIDGEWYAVLNDDKKVVKYNKNAKGFYQYEIMFRYAKSVKINI